MNFYNRKFDSKKQILSVFILILFIIMIWTLLFKKFEWLSFFDSLYFTIITFATIWYGDITPVTQWWKIVAMIYGLLGVPLFVGIISVIMELKIITSLKNYSKKTNDKNNKIYNEIISEEEQLKQIKKEIKIIEKKLNKK